MGKALKHGPDLGMEEHGGSFMRLHAHPRDSIKYCSDCSCKWGLRVNLELGFRCLCPSSIFPIDQGFEGLFEALSGRLTLRNAETLARDTELAWHGRAQESCQTSHKRPIVEGDMSASHQSA